MSTSKMRGLSLLRTLFIGLGLLRLTLPTLGQTPTFTLLHSFGRGKDGSRPVASLIQATNGSFYGTTQYGGNYIPDYWMRVLARFSALGLPDRRKCYTGSCRTGN